MLQRRLKTLSPATKTWFSQIKLKKKKKEPLLEPVWLEKGSLAEIPQNSYHLTMWLHKPQLCLSDEGPIPTGPPPSSPLFPSSCSRIASLVREEDHVAWSGCLIFRETAGQWEVTMEGESHQTPRALKDEDWGLDQDSSPQSVLPWVKMRKETSCSRNGNTKPTSGLDLG